MGLGLCAPCLARWPSAKGRPLGWIQAGPSALDCASPRPTRCGPTLACGSPLIRVGPYKGSLRQLILRAKEEPHSPALKVLTQAILEQINFWGVEPGWLLVPPPSLRRRWQGWHLAEEVARKLASQLGWKFMPLLRRRRSVQAQAGLGAAARRVNLQGAFALSRRIKIQIDRGLVLPKRVWLLDDVYTTGATWLECRRVLEDAGIHPTGALMLAQVDFDPVAMPESPAQTSVLPAISPEARDELLASP